MKRNGNQSAANGAPPEWGGIRLGKTLTGVLYFLLLGSAALALWGWRFPGRLPAALAHAAPWLFCAFLVVFTFYRLGLMRAKRYPPGKGFFQIAVGAIFFLLLLPSAHRRYQRAPETLLQALSDPNPEVRQLAAEVAGLRPDGKKYARALVRALEDPDPAVRKRAHAALVRWTGVDLGSPDDAAALAAWKERYP